MGYRGTKRKPVVPDARSERRRRALEIKSLREARETIRKFDEVLAFRLDILSPIDDCPHSPVTAGYSNSMGAFKYPDYVCVGCGVGMTMSGHGSWRSVNTIRVRTSHG